MFRVSNTVSANNTVPITRLSNLYTLYNYWTQFKRELCYKLIFLDLQMSCILSRGAEQFGTNQFSTDTSTRNDAREAECAMLQVVAQIHTRVL